MARRAKAPTRRRILDAAQRLFEARGYNGTGIAEVLHASGANAGSLYHFFSSKEELLLAVLDRHVERLDDDVLRVAERRSGSPTGRVTALLQSYRTTLRRSRFRRGCPVGDLALEVSTVSPEARRRVAEYFDKWCAGVRRWLQQGDQALEGSRAENQARLLLSMLQGALMQARALASMAPFDASMEHVSLLLGAGADRNRGRRRRRPVTAQ